MKRKSTFLFSIITVFTISYCIYAFRSTRGFIYTTVPASASIDNIKGQAANSEKNHKDKFEPNDMDRKKHKKNRVSDEVLMQALKALDSYHEGDKHKERDLRKFPYPYNGMLAISSDVDNTTLGEFKTYHKFLNTRELTDYGEGVGLDIGDSMWMYKDDKYLKEDENIMTFYKGTDVTKRNNADEIIQFIHSGWIDSLHAIGDFSTDNEKDTKFNRKLAVDAWSELGNINPRLTVWINHGNRSNVQNFGASDTSKFMSYQQGDDAKSPYYNSDLSIENGIKYVWNSVGDSNFGHDCPIYKISLRDGKKVWGFHRYTNNFVNGKTDWTWTPKELHRQINEANLNNLIKNKQYSIVAQHFGIDAKSLFLQDNIKALRTLANYQVDGKILVAKTSRLLNYANMHRNVTYNKTKDNDMTYINIVSVDDPIFGRSVPTLGDVRGITFYCDDPENTILLIDKREVEPDEIQVNPKDETGQASISIKWFSPDYNDYTKS